MLDAGDFDGEPTPALEVSMQALNCWERTRCGREPGGTKVGDLGVCPAAIDVACDGVNHGHHAGRICWAVAGTLCEGKVQGRYAEKRLTCLGCLFLSEVQEAEGPNFRMLPPGWDPHAKTW